MTGGFSSSSSLSFPTPEDGCGAALLRFPSPAGPPASSRSGVQPGRSTPASPPLERRHRHPTECVYPLRSSTRRSRSFSNSRRLSTIVIITIIVVITSISIKHPRPALRKRPGCWMLATAHPVGGSSVRRASFAGKSIPSHNIAMFSPPSPHRAALAHWRRKNNYASSSAWRKCRNLQRSGQNDYISWFRDFFFHQNCHHHNLCN